MKPKFVIINIQNRFSPYDSNYNYSFLHQLMSCVSVPNDEQNSIIIQLKMDCCYLWKGNILLNSQLTFEDGE